MDSKERWTRPRRRVLCARAATEPDGAAASASGASRAAAADSRRAEAKLSTHDARSTQRQCHAVMRRPQSLPLAWLLVAASSLCRLVHAAADKDASASGSLHVSTILSMALLLPLTLTLFCVTLIAAIGARGYIRADGRGTGSDKRYLTGRGSSEDPPVGTSPPLPLAMISPTSAAATAAAKPIASHLLLTQPIVLITVAPTAATGTGGSTNVAPVSPRPSPSKNALFPARPQQQSQPQSPQRSRLSGGGFAADPISRASSGRSPPQPHRSLRLPAPTVTGSAEATTNRVRASAISAADHDKQVSRSPSHHLGGGLGAFLSPAASLSPGGSGSRRVSSGARPSQTAASLYGSRVSVRAVNMRPYEPRGGSGGSRRGTAGASTIKVLTSAAAAVDPDQEQTDADADGEGEGEAEAEPEPEPEEDAAAAPDPSIAQAPARLMRRRLGVLLRLCFMATSFFAFLAGLAVSASVFLHVSPAPAATLSASQRIDPSSANHAACVGFSKVAGGGYVLCKASAYLFFFVKQRLVQVRPHASGSSSSSSSSALRASSSASGTRLSLMEKLSLLITLGVIPFAGSVSWQLTGASNALDGTCEVWMPLVLNIVMISADFILSLTYLWLFLKPLLAIMQINRMARARAAAMMQAQAGGGGGNGDGNAPALASSPTTPVLTAAAAASTPIRDPLERIMRTNTITCVASISSTILAMLFMMFAHIYESPILQKHIVTVGVADVTLTSCCIMLLMLQSASISAKPQQQQQQQAQQQQQQQTSLQAPQQHEPTAKRKLRERGGIDAAAGVAVGAAASSDAPPRGEWARHGTAGRSIESSYSGSSGGGGGQKVAMRSRSSRLDPVSSSAASDSAALHATPGHLARALSRRSHRHSLNAPHSLLSGVQLTALNGSQGGGDGGGRVRLRLYLPPSAPSSRPSSRPGSRPVSRPPSQPPSPRLSPAAGTASSMVDDLSASEGAMFVQLRFSDDPRSSSSESPNPLSPLAQHSAGSAGGGGTALSHTSGSSDESPPALIDSPPPPLSSDGIVSLSPMHSTPSASVQPNRSLSVALPASPMRSPFGGSGSFATTTATPVVASASPHRAAVGTFAASLRVREVRDPPVASPSSSPPISPALRSRTLNLNSNLVASQQLLASSALLDLPSLMDQYRVRSDGGVGGGSSVSAMLGPPSPQRASASGNRNSARVSHAPVHASPMPAPLARHLSPDRAAAAAVTFAAPPASAAVQTAQMIPRQCSADSAFVSSSASASAAFTSPSESRRSTATASGVDSCDPDSAAAVKRGTLLAAASSTASSGGETMSPPSRMRQVKLN